MNFTAKDVAALREKTGCGMMDCKKALTEAEGNMDKAVDLLREKGLAASVKKAGRIAAEGVAFATVSECGKVAVVIEVNAETDFVAKNAEFQAFVKTCADTVIAQNPADVEALLQCKAEGTDLTVDALLKGEDPGHRREHQDPPLRPLRGRGHLLRPRRRPHRRHRQVRHHR